MTASQADYVCKKCRSRAGFIFQPKKPSSVNLKALSKKIMEKGAEINASTPSVLVAKYNGTIVTFYANGKVLIKSDSEQIAGKILLKLVS